jgi:tetratricopeptide (TPR) repeat protein
MNGKGFWLAPAVCLLCTGLAAAQMTPGRMGGTRDLTPAQRQSLYEDIEILRRILNQTFVRLSGLPSSPKSVVFWDFSESMNVPLGETALRLDVVPHLRADGTLTSGVVLDDGAKAPHHALGGAHHFAGAEGNYVPGHGVVYSVTLPVSHAWEFKLESAKPSRRPLSPWERIRSELRGEKVKPEDGDRGRKEVSLPEAVLRILAENGRHFASLGEHEQLTIAITLREHACMTCHAAGPERRSGMSGRMESDMMGAAGMGSADGAADRGGRRGMMGSMQGSLGGLGRGSPARTGSPDGTSAASRPSEIQDYLLLLDLHLKQGRAREAVDVYQKALQTTDEEFIRRVYLDLQGVLPNVDQVRRFLADKDPQKRKNVIDQLVEAVPSRPKAATLDAAAVQSNLGAIELHLKAAQAYLALGEAEKAREALRRTVGYAQSAEKISLLDPARETRPSKPAEAAAAVALPAKLILTASKRLLDQVGTGKISFEEFRKAATVEYVTFPAAEKNSSAPASPPVKSGGR